MMKRQACFREFLMYSSLNVLGMLGLSCYILADTFFVSQRLGSNGLAALNLAIPIYSFIHGSGLMLGMGGATRYSILRNQGKEASGNVVFTQTVLQMICLMALFCFTGLFLAEPAAILLGARGDVLVMSRKYLQVLLLFSPAFLCNEVLLCFVRNDGMPQRSMLAMLVGSFSNILLDYLFLFVCRMGMFGAALATGLAPVISLIILSPCLLHGRVRFRFVLYRLWWKGCWRIPATGFPSLVTEMSSGIVMVVFNFILLGLRGNTGVAAYGIIANLSLVVMAIYTGIAQGIQPMLSKYYGAGDKGRIRQTFRYAVMAAGVLSAVLYLGLFCGADAIVSLFNSGRDALLQGIAVQGMKIYFAAGLFAGWNIVLAVYFASTSYVKQANFISLMRGFALIIPAAFLLSAFGGITGLWLAFPVTECVVAAAGIFSYCKCVTT